MSIVYDKHNHKMVDTDFHDSFCGNCGEIVDLSDEIVLCVECADSEHIGNRYG